jgi:hypothetical protein
MFNLPNDVVATFTQPELNTNPGVNVYDPRTGMVNFTSASQDASQGETSGAVVGALVAALEQWAATPNLKPAEVDLLRAVADLQRCLKMQSGAEIPVVEALAKLGIKLNGGKVSI